MKNIKLVLMVLISISLIIISILIFRENESITHSLKEVASVIQ
jgi:uncharacterized protein YoxC